MGQKVLIVGGVAGGASTAARLRRMDENAEIIMFERGEYISFANCGLPYYIGEVITQKSKLLVQTPEGMKARFNIDVRIMNEVIDVDADKKQITVKDLKDSSEYTESYDKLVLSPGAEPIVPPIPGIEKAALFTLRNIPDTYAIKDFIDINKPERAVVVGGGFIGLEMVENLTQRGIKTTLVELANQVMLSVDADMAAYVHQHLKEKNVELYLNNGVSSFDKNSDGQTIVKLQSGTELTADIVILSIGVKPETTLAVKAGIEIGSTGGIKVDEHMLTSNPYIYAVGDAVEVTDYVTGRPAVIPLAGPANKQGRIAANNIAGVEDTYKNTQGTSIAKVFDLSVASTGSNEKKLKAEGIEYLRTYTHASSHASYYPGSKSLSLKLLYTPVEGKILGAQIVGFDGVDKRIDVLATAIRAGLNVHDLTELELSYAPPFSTAKDPVNMAGYVSENTLDDSHTAFYWDDIANIDYAKSVLVDVRTLGEYNDGTIPGCMHIPVDDFRARIDELPKDKEILIFCLVGLRGHVAARIAIQHGFNTKNLAGGYKTWSTVTAQQDNPGIF